MLLGYNHNVTYKGEVYHVQTEDSGLRNPHIVTLLYRAGVILCSRKTSYADILKIDNLEAVVEDLMKEQHKEMMRRLKNGEFDDKITALMATAAKPEVAISAAASGDDPPVPAAVEAVPASAAAPRLDQSAAGQRGSLDEAVERFFAGMKQKS